MSRILTAVCLSLGLSACAGNSYNLYADDHAETRRCTQLQKLFGEQDIDCVLKSERRVWARDFPMGINAFDAFADHYRTITAQLAVGNIDRNEFDKELRVSQQELYAFYVKYRDVQRGAQMQEDDKTSAAIGNLIQILFQGVVIAAQARANADAAAIQAQPVTVNCRSNAIGQTVYTRCQ